MATIVTGSKVEVKLFCRSGTQVSINVLHFAATIGTGASLSDKQFADLFSTDMSSRYRDYLPTVSLYLGCRVQIIRPLPAPVAVISTNGTGSGSIAADPLPPAAALLVTKRTPISGREFRGRVYLPFFPETYNSADGSPEAAAIAAGTVWASGAFTTKVWVSGTNSMTMVPILFHKADGSSTDITDYLVRPQWATQRRRSAINRADSFGP